MEDKIVYRDGDQIRAVRGTIIDENDLEVTIERRNETITIMKSEIKRIHRAKEGN